jgi:hypothetical protein
MEVDSQRETGIKIKIISFMKVNNSPVSYISPGSPQLEEKKMETITFSYPLNSLNSVIILGYFPPTLYKLTKNIFPNSSLMNKGSSQR